MNGTKWRRFFGAAPFVVMAALVIAYTPRDWITVYLVAVDTMLAMYLWHNSPFLID